MADADTMRFAIAVMFALVGTAVAIVVAVRVWRRRGRTANRASSMQTPSSRLTARDVEELLDCLPGMPPEFRDRFLALVRARIEEQRS